MIASMVIGLHSGRTGCADVLRLPPPVARVDRDQPRFDPEMHPASSGSTLALWVFASEPAERLTDLRARFDTALS
jgi:hypothetical protein